MGSAVAAGRAMRIRTGIRPGGRRNARRLAESVKDYRGVTKYYMLDPKTTNAADIWSRVEENHP